ncbi:unnamed protein product [Rhizoctonia solani]|uniref:Uncharacterized protein n=1 Tax=Rhizoctonia solani TaxID=456999 RepID=A0A8H3BKC4_9AGAM|nr:unnamed protein product [Rhizoctonia solani]
MRVFKKSTADLETFETPREFSARQRRAAAKAQQSNLTEAVQITLKRCKLNLNTPKFHSIGHYVDVIRFFGTTDSYSTQTTELQHRKVKRQWERTNMKDAVPQMARIGGIGDVLRGIKDRLDRLRLSNPSDDGTSLPQPDHTAIPNLDAYSIGQSDRSKDAFNLPLWIHRNRQDFAVKFFIPLLKEHILTRIHGANQLTDLHKITIQNDRLYSHATLQINYTSYDVLGIYQAHIRIDRPPARRKNFLWVRWLDYNEVEPGSWENCRLDRVVYGKCRNEFELRNAFGLIAPHHLIRVAHLIPDFESGTTNPPSRTSYSDNEGSDWKHYYVSRFVDRDMFMRHLGGAIGHFNQSPRAKVLSTQYTVRIDGEGEGLDINRVPIEAEEQIGSDEEDAGGGENTGAAAVDPSTDRDVWWDGEDDDTDSNSSGNDDGLEDETDDEFIETLYDL